MVGAGCSWTQPIARLLRSILLAAPALLPIPALAQEAVILDLKGPGTAAVYLSRGDRTAYITDGGKGGNRGLMGATLDGKPVLDAILDRGFDRLVIICSHPHSDHLDGLVAMVQSERMRDPRIREVHFVDSGYPRGASLHDIYEGSRSRGAGPGPPASYHSADNADAFEGLRREGANVVASNFRYEAEGKAHPHGRCIIAQYELRNSGRSERIVDFDDAESNLVARWRDWATADPANRRPDTILLPHHGSLHTEIGPLLDPRIRPRRAIVTVNPENQYRHPGPAILRKVIEALGKENVFFTGESGNLAFDERGLDPRADLAGHKLDYERFLQKQWIDAMTEILPLEETERAGRLDAGGVRQLEALRDTGRDLADLREVLAVDPVERDRELSVAGDAAERRIAGEFWIGPSGSSSLGLPAFPGPNEPFSPVLAHAHAEALRSEQAEAAAARALRDVHERLRLGDVEGAHRLAGEALAAGDADGRLALSPLEAESLEDAMAAAELARYSREGGAIEATDAVLRRAARWPRLAASPVGERAGARVRPRRDRRLQRSDRGADRGDREDG
jgi:hypothetical protein